MKASKKAEERILYNITAAKLLIQFYLSNILVYPRGTKKNNRVNDLNLIVSFFLKWTIQKKTLNLLSNLSTT